MRKGLVLLLLFAAAFAVTLAVVRGPREIGKLPSLLAEAEEMRQSVDAWKRDLLTSRSIATVRLDDTELRRLLLVSLSDSEGGRKAMSRVKAFGVTLNDDRLELRARVDFSELLDPEAGAANDAVPLELLGKLASIGGGEVWLRLVGTPIVRGGGVALASEDLELWLGPLPLPVDLLAERGADIETALRFEIEGLHAEEVRIEAGELVLRVREV